MNKELLTVHRYKSFYAVLDRSITKGMFVCDDGSYGPIRELNIGWLSEEISFYKLPEDAAARVVAETKDKYYFRVKPC